MNRTLEHFILTYATAPRQVLQQEMAKVSRATLESSFIDLLTIYLNDTNSSTLREWLTLRLAGYQPIEGKLGYNGYRLVGPRNQKQKQVCEVKPKNVRRRGDGKVTHRLDGGGSYSDYTPERWYKDLKNQVQMVLSGFAEGRLLYVIEVPFVCIRERLRQLLQNKFPGWDPQQDISQWQRPPNTFLRSASFNFKHYRHCGEVKLHYCAPDLQEFADFLNREFLGFLLNLCGKGHSNG